MDLHDILVVGAHSEAGWALLEVARRLGGRMGAEVRAILVVMDADAANVDTANARCEAALGGQPGHDRCVLAIGSGETLTRRLLARARLADLVIVGQGCAASIVEALVFGAGRPVLIVPADGAGDIGGRVVIAWSDSREAARAMSDSLPLLHKASDIRVLNVRPISGEGGAETAALAAYLGRHGLRAQMVRAFAAGAGVGEAILAHARAADADLLVLGAQCHEETDRRWLGAVTREMLGRATLPMLISN